MQYNRKKYGYGGSVDRLRMAFGGKMKYAQEGAMIDGDPKKKREFYSEPVTRVQDISYRDNEGMQQAQSAGKIDAYNFDVPASGRLSDLPQEQQDMLRQTDFGQAYLSGEGDIDEQYNRYAAKVVSGINEDPEGALKAINAMIESGNPNFQGLAGMSDQEKLDTAKRYMTDRRVGDFHGAISFAEEFRPKASFYNPTDDVRSAGFKGYEASPVLYAVGDRALNPGDVSKFMAFADESGVDVTEDSTEARKLLSAFLDENGYQERGPEEGDDSNFRGAYQGTDNSYFINRANKEFESGMQSSAEKAKERARREQEEINRQKALRAQRGYGNGGLIYKRKSMNLGGKMDGDRVLGVSVSQSMKDNAARTRDVSSPFRVRQQGWDAQGNSTYDVSYSPLLNALRRRDRVKGSF